MIKEKLKNPNKKFKPIKRRFVTLMFNLTEAQKNKISDLAKSKGLSLSDMLRRIIDQYKD